MKDLEQLQEEYQSMEILIPNDGRTDAILRQSVVGVIKENADGYLISLFPSTLDKPWFQQGCGVEWFDTLDGLNLFLDGCEIISNQRVL